SACVEFCVPIRGRVSFLFARPLSRRTHRGLTGHLMDIVAAGPEHYGLGEGVIVHSLIREVRGEGKRLAGPLSYSLSWSESHLSHVCHDVALGAVSHFLVDLLSLLGEQANIAVRIEKPCRRSDPQLDVKMERTGEVASKFSVAHLLLSQEACHPLQFAPVR